MPENPKRYLPVTELPRSFKERFESLSHIEQVLAAHSFNGRAIEEKSLKGLFTLYRHCIATNFIRETDEEVENRVRTAIRHILDTEIFEEQTPTKNDPYDYVLNIKYAGGLKAEFEKYKKMTVAELYEIFSQPDET